MSIKDDLRVIFVGNSQVGKTALMNRFIDGEFSAPTQSTVNPIFTPKSAISENGTEIMMQLWDTAGQEKFQALSQVFYRDANVAAICIDLSDSATFSTVSVWKERVLTHEPECKLILVGTKHDLVQGDAKNKALQELSEAAEAAHIEYFYITSAKTGEGVNELFVQIATMGEAILTKPSNAPQPSKITVDDQNCCEEGRAPPPKKPLDNCCKL